MLLTQCKIKLELGFYFGGCGVGHRFASGGNSVGIACLYETCPFLQFGFVFYNRNAAVVNVNVVKLAVINRENTPLDAIVEGNVNNASKT